MEVHRDIALAGNIKRSGKQENIEAAAGKIKRREVQRDIALAGNIKRRGEQDNIAAAGNIKRREGNIKRRGEKENIEAAGNIKRRKEKRIEQQQGI